MKSDGYTLAEALAAMLILGLAMGGLVEGARVIGRLQTPTLVARRDSQTLRRAETSLASLLALRNGTDQSLKGDDQAFSKLRPTVQAKPRLRPKGEPLVQKTPGSSLWRFAPPSGSRG